MSRMPWFTEWAKEQAELARVKKSADISTFSFLLVTADTLLAVRIIKRRTGVAISDSVAVTVLWAIWGAGLARLRHRAPLGRVFKSAAIGAGFSFIVVGILRVVSRW